MFSTFITQLQTIALAAGAPGVFTLALLQEIVPPIPSTFVTTMSGFLLMEGAPLAFGSVMRLLMLVGLPVALGMTLGASVIYGIVYWGGAPLVKRFGHLVGIAWDDIERLQARLAGTWADEAILFAARAFPLTPSVLLNIVAGLVRWNPISFILSTFFGTLIRATWSGFIGWKLGEALLPYVSLVERWNAIILVASAFAVAAYLLYRKRTAAKPQML